MSTAASQDLKPSPQQMRDSLQQTGRIAAVESQGAVPFHLSATFTTFDYLGKPAGEGSLDETWLRPGVAHRVITFRGERRDQIANNGSVRDTADNFSGSYMERRIIAALLDPVPESAKLPDGATLAYKDFKVAGGKLDCIIVKPAPLPQPAVSEDGPTTAYCADPVSHILRLRQERYDFVVVYNRLVGLGGHKLAESIEISQNGRPRARLTVTSFEPRQNLSDKDFVLPGNATDLSKEDIEVPGEVIAGTNIKKVQPVYPDVAKRNNISGTVFLSAIISKEGAVRDLDVISSPSPDLTASAIQAVKQWKYKPYLLNGAATEVDTTIRVNYSFY